MSGLPKFCVRCGMRIPKASMFGGGGGGFEFREGTHCEECASLKRETNIRKSQGRKK